MPEPQALVQLRTKDGLNCDPTFTDQQPMPSDPVECLLFHLSLPTSQVVESLDLLRELLDSPARRPTFVDRRRMLITEASQHGVLTYSNTLLLVSKIIPLAERLKMLQSFPDNDLAATLSLSQKLVSLSQKVVIQYSQAVDRLGRLQSENDADLNKSHLQPVFEVLSSTWALTPLCIQNNAAVQDPTGSNQSIQPVNLRLLLSNLKKLITRKRQPTESVRMSERTLRKNPSNKVVKAPAKYVPHQPPVQVPTSRTGLVSRINPFRVRSRTRRPITTEADDLEAIRSAICSLAAGARSLKELVESIVIVSRLLVDELKARKSMTGIEKPNQFTTCCKFGRDARDIIGKCEDFLTASLKTEEIMYAITLKVD